MGQSNQTNLGQVSRRSRGMGQQRELPVAGDEMTWEKKIPAAQS